MHEGKSTLVEQMNERFQPMDTVATIDGSYVMLDDRGVPTKKEDISTPLPEVALSHTNAAQEISSVDNIAQSNIESNGTEPEKINFADAKTERQRYQLAQQADRDAKKSNQQQADD